jgi:hypothetical protein
MGELAAGNASPRSGTPPASGPSSYSPKGMEVESGSRFCNLRGYEPGRSFGRSGTTTSTRMPLARRADPAGAANERRPLGHEVEPASAFLPGLPVSSPLPSSSTTPTASTPVMRNRTAERSHPEWARASITASRRIWNSCSRASGEAADSSPSALRSWVIHGGAEVRTMLPATSLPAPCP